MDFRGYIEEFPEIRVDYFKNVPGQIPPTYVFLSHMHSDHLTGFENKKVGHRLTFCSAATKELVLSTQTKPISASVAVGKKPEVKYSHLQNKESGVDYLQALPIGVPQVLDLGSYKLTVTLFDANHCPGSVMFLFEGNGKAVLYTGDIRIEPWSLSILKHDRALFPYIYGPKSLDNIYFEMICAKRPRDVELQPNAECISQLIKLIERYPPNAIFLFYFTTKGYEDVFLRLHAYFGVKIHMDPTSYAQFERLSDPAVYSRGMLFTPPKKSGSLHDHSKACLTTDLTRFRSCHPNCPCATRNLPGVVHAKVSVAAPLATVLKRNSPLPITTKCESILESKDAKGLPINVCEISKLHRPAAYESDFNSLINSQYIYSANKSYLLPCHIRYFFSRHSSFSEIHNLIKVFKPKQVYPFDHGIPGDKKLRMKDIFGEVCSGDHIFRFDQERAVYEQQTMQRIFEKSSESEIQDSSIHSSSVEGLAESLWFEESLKSSQEPKETSRSTLAPVIQQPKEDKIELPLFGNTPSSRPQKGWNCVDVHGVSTDTQEQIFANNEANFVSPASSIQKYEYQSDAKKDDKAKGKINNEDSPERDYEDILNILWAQSGESESENDVVELAHNSKSTTKQASLEFKSQDMAHQSQHNPISMPMSDENTLEYISRSESRKRTRKTSGITKAQTICLGRRTSRRVISYGRKTVMVYQRRLVKPRNSFTISFYSPTRQSSNF